jgi:imidazolonepropionase
MWDKIFYNATIATCAETAERPTALAIADQKIVWLGDVKDFDQPPERLAHEVMNVQGKLLTPGLIDCHTHLVYAGNRAHEFALKLQGVSYQEIARLGGGIQATVKMTQAASFDELYEQSAGRLEAALKNGSTTIEIKSGYGLTKAGELKQLAVIEALAKNFPGIIYPTYLAAHCLPVEYQHDSEAYINLICQEILPEVAKKQLARAVDAFCESIAFNVQQIERVFKTAKQYGLDLKLHAEQFSLSDGAALASAFKALSADHLEYINESGIAAMANAGTVAVLLPGAFYFLQEKQMPPIDLLRRYHVPIALATDCNPGTSPTTSLPLMMNMAATQWRLTPLETLRGVTINAAKALGLSKTLGSLEINKQADLLIWPIFSVEELSYYMGSVKPEVIYIKGKKI